MIIKVVPKSSESGSYFHDFFVEADQFEIAFHPGQPSDADCDWSYTEDQTIPETGPVYAIRGWNHWPRERFTMGYVWSGRIYLINDSGKTVDKYVI